MNIIEIVKDFVSRVNANGRDAQVIFIHPEDIQSIGRKILGTVFSLHSDIIPKNTEMIFSSHDCVFFGKCILEYHFDWKVGVELDFNCPKGRAKLYYKDGSEREVRLS